MTRAGRKWRISHDVARIQHVTARQRRQCQSRRAGIARSLEIVEQSGLDYRLHAMGTILEGDWNQVFGVLKRCIDRMSQDCDRITLTIKADYRRGHSGRLEAKVRSVEEKLGRKIRNV